MSIRRRFCCFSFLFTALCLLWSVKNLIGWHLAHRLSQTKLNCISRSVRQEPRVHIPKTEVKPNWAAAAAFEFTLAGVKSAPVAAAT